MMSVLLLIAVTFLLMNTMAKDTKYDQHLTARCIASHVYHFKKIDSDIVYLAHNSDVWTNDQIAILQDILHDYNASKVHLVIVGWNKSSEDTFEHYKEVNPTTMKRLFKKRTKEQEIEKGKNKRKENSTQYKTLQEVLFAHPEISLKKINYTEAFRKSPLNKTWQNLNENTRLFALRTIYLWQYGGVSFDLLKGNSKNNSRYINKLTNSNQTASVENLLGFETYRNLTKGVVTIDDKGWRIESETSCHAFFGDMLINLKTAKSNATQEQVIKMTLEVYCKERANDSNNCTTVK